MDNRIFVIGVAILSGIAAVIGLNVYKFVSVRIRHVHRLGIEVYYIRVGTNEYRYIDGKIVTLSEIYVGSAFNQIADTKLADWLKSKIQLIPIKPQQSGPTRRWIRKIY